MSSHATSADWPRACSLLTEAGPDRGVHQTFPSSQRQLSLLAAAASAAVASSPVQFRAGQALSESLQAIVTQAASLQHIGNCPVVGITGLLNSGKSSLLSAYLSPAGRTRVLRGTANDQGTHRFVLWLPEVWYRQEHLLKILHNYIRDLFGVFPEHLDDDPQRAFAQYNGQVLNPTDQGSSLPADGVDPLQIPLLAYDAGLNRLGLALLDCPDIQTAFRPAGHEDKPGSGPTSLKQLDAAQLQERRRQLLGQVGRLCSAFLVVTKLSSLHDDTLLSIFETLRHTMPDVRRILCVNKVKARYAPRVVDEQALDLVKQFDIAHVYMAYDFRSHWAEQRLPPAPESLQATSAEPLPIFFRAENVSDNLQAPKKSTDPTELIDGETNLAGMRPPRVASYLQDLAQLLNPGSLVVESRRSIHNQLERLSAQCLDWFDSNQLERDRQVHDAWQTIADACYTFMAQQEGSEQSVNLRLQTSPAIVAQMSDSLVKAAPWTMRPSLWVDRTMRKLQSSIASGVMQVRWLQNLSASLSSFVGSFRKGTAGKVVTSQRFQHQLKRCDTHGALLGFSDEALTLACEQALSRFQKEDSSRLDQAWLDKWSAELWQHMPLKRMIYVGVMPLAPIFGPLLAVTLIPFDAGGSAVLVFATTKELLMAAGLAALATPALTGGNVQDLVERETAFSQLSELFAMTCDSLGVRRPESHQLPRVNVGGALRALKPSQLAVRTASDESALAQWTLAPNYRVTLQQAFSQLRAHDQQAETL